MSKTEQQIVNLLKIQQRASLGDMSIRRKMACHALIEKGVLRVSAVDTERRFTKGDGFRLVRVIQVELVNA